MELSLQIQEKVNYLDDNKKRLILEIIDNFLPESEDDDMPEDLYFIRLAEAELANGEAAEWADIEWKEK
ncbi:MAG: hypothetical protein FWB71_04980 [Defluviitaleaceae bacterium]|nr:hypothetical protein [Defluviitaleaceae bacterium]